ncbi:hypothetical protein DVH24_001823 [Malus domestica]|uniref:Uncharacterized protein n=1 Tax=Malus domestica TaxID=3750 RepID=A0A498I8B5_MALDO|nr:hypothetical protein DVH24_001823 [Malus domestica]
MLTVSNLRSNDHGEDVVALVLWWMQVRRDKIEEATKKRGLKRQERSICLGQREKDKGGGYGG